MKIYIQQNADISHIYIQKIVVTIKERPTYDPVNIYLFDLTTNGIILLDSVHFSYFSAVGGVLLSFS